ncbi:type II toxin-antitoxin system RelE family toxin [Testudinibacter sp. TR-2022]|uniref:type II toxin-antitoxin system RelE family toxin n=1 Tax=Testudinibacter sp. TR-2022 TaxID=2585029 RepID=UPI001118008F|nr:type II toxin-antitoxin system RelE/ParE family toxin [Testudinibacter sp. TR-2022]TNH06724.1 type II toxin-antitoxin system RelE/ParE family toxin [Pasteurellaceae bacterium Phil11]TNH22473.1 type II toxin-antitoxin system RelE/ParE family toxin [Testudinibacter sp. TR-2022]
MTYRLVISDAFKKDLKKIDRTQGERILAFLFDNINGCEDPRVYGKALKGGLRDKWSYRVGDYRILAHIDDGIVTVTIAEVGHRKQVYKRR